MWNLKQICNKSCREQTVVYQCYQYGGGLPADLDGKESAWNAGDTGSIPGLERPPGEEMETQSSILTWEIRRTEEPGRLQSMGSQRVGHDWATSQHPHTPQDGKRRVGWKWKWDIETQTAKYNINKQQEYIIQHWGNQPLFWNNFKWSIDLKKTSNQCVFASKPNIIL